MSLSLNYLCCQTCLPMIAKIQPIVMPTRDLRNFIHSDKDEDDDDYIHSDSKSANYEDYKPAANTHVIVIDDSDKEVGNTVNKALFKEQPKKRKHHTVTSGLSEKEEKKRRAGIWRKSYLKSKDQMGTITDGMSVLRLSPITMFTLSNHLTSLPFTIVKRKELNKLKQQYPDRQRGSRRKNQCSVPGCENLARKAGLCRTHGPRCSVVGCENAVNGGGVCGTHGPKKQSQPHQSVRQSPHQQRPPLCPSPRLCLKKQEEKQTRFWPARWPKPVVDVPTQKYQQPIGP